MYQAVHDDDGDAGPEVAALELVRIVAARGIGQVDDPRRILFLSGLSVLPFRSTIHVASFRAFDARRLASG
jgi:hypothetical protein